MLLMLLIIGCAAGCTDIEAQTPGATTPTISDTPSKPLDTNIPTQPSSPPVTDFTTVPTEPSVTQPPQDNTPETEPTLPEATTPPVHVHDYVVQVTEPGCTSEGYSTYTCSSCNHTYSGDITPQRGHEYSDWVITKAPDCINAGESTRTCIRCGHTQVQQMLVPGHQYTVTTVNPTCTEDGYTGDEVCTKCNETVKTGTVIKAEGHRYGNWVTSKEPTGFETGSKYRTCTTCKAKETASIPKTELYPIIDEGEGYKITITREWYKKAWVYVAHLKFS